MPLSLLALAVASFGIGTTEFVIMGLLPDVATDLGVTIPAAGLLVSGYALGVTLGGPVVAIALAQLRRKRALLGLVALFIAGNLACALAPTYGLLMAARLLTALSHGSFFGIGSVVAAGLVPRSQRSRAIALLFSGFALANVLGVPLGTLLGQALGWRATFWAIVPIGVVAAILIAWLLPAPAEPEPTRLRAEIGALRHRQVSLALATSVLFSASLFSVFTYITPILQTVSGFSPHAVSAVLLLFGVGISIGNLLGGRLADWRLMPALIGALCLTAVIMAALRLTAASPSAMAITVLLWGAIAFAAGPPLQTRVVNEARGAPNIAATLNQSAFNLGNAIGAWLGGAVLTAGANYLVLPWLGAALALAAASVAALARQLEQTAHAAASACASGD
jgi:DHA1 family inner membrane transport protein